MARQRKNLQGTTITVTALDIKRGKAGSADSCAITRATTRTLGRKTMVGDSVSVRYGSDEVDYELPKRAITFINRFDSNETVKPFAFRLGKRIK
jgi:hypothetical protein